MADVDKSKMVFFFLFVGDVSTLAWLLEFNYIKIITFTGLKQLTHFCAKNFNCEMIY